MTRDWRWTLRRVFRLPATPRGTRRELDDELRFHLDGRVEELMEREHLARPDAEREAQRRFGDYETYRREMQHIDLAMRQRRNRMEVVETLRRETRHALRSLSRAPSFSVITLVTLMLGLGAATAIFTMLDRVVLRPLPYANSDRLIHLGTRWPGLKPDLEFDISTFMYFRFRSAATTLERVGIYRSSALPLPAADGFDAERVATAATSASIFSVLGIHPELGETYTDDDGLPLTPAVAVLSHELWMRRFGGDRSIIGRSIDVGAASVRVIGVLPAGARLPDATPQLWLPDHLIASDHARNAHTYRGVALMKRGVTPQQAGAELTTLVSQIVADNPDAYSDQFMKKTGFGFFVRPLRDEIVGPRVARVMWITFASVAIVLLIAAANVANLFLVRIEARRRDTAVRTALGAGRVQLAVHHLAESCTLAIAAAAGALALAAGLLRVALALAPSTLPRLDEVHLDWRSAVFCVATSVVAGIVFGLLPLVRSGLDLGALRDGGRSLTSSRARHAARQTLIVSQMALAAVLLASAGLMLRSFENLHAVRPGFDANGVVVLRISLPQRRYHLDVESAAFWHELARGIEALPGVQSVGGAETVPLEGNQDGCTALTAPESPLEESQRSACLPEMTVLPGFFRAMRIPVAGHEPDWSDDERGAGSMVVSRAFAERIWPGESAIGKTLIYSVRRPLVFTVTGVAEDVHGNGLQRPPTQMAYFPITAPAVAPPVPFSDMNANYQNIVVRSSRADWASVAADVRKIVTRLDPQVPVASIESMPQIVARSIAETSFTMTLMLLSAFIALTLSAVGIYGVISYIVGQRRAEIGIRMALGAQARDVSEMVVGQSAKLAAMGIGIGVLAALGSARLLRSLLFDVSPSDPLVLVASCAVLVVVTLAASVGPARRATRIDPVEAMRA